jgi:N6-adenosine-specific RNA methylase IME4
MRVANDVESLADSIGKIGLLNPITLRRDQNRLILIAGLRRLEATKLLKEGEIRARIVDMDATKAMLAEIDENLQRAELTALQHAHHVAERKKVWEALYPQTRHGGAPPKRDGKGGKAPSQGKDDKLASLPTTTEAAPRTRSFVAETAKKGVTSPRTVARAAQIGEGICSKAQNLLLGTPVEDRKDDLLKIARLSPEDQIAVAQVIHDGKEKTYLRAKRLLEAEAIKAEPPPLPAGPFRVIVVDPPWCYEKRNDDASKRENFGYASMSIEAIRGLDVRSLAEKDAVLWLWTTNAHLPEAFSVAEAWGFTYKTLLTWDKVKPGMGEWLRGLTEHCLMCVRGKPTVLLKAQTTIIRETVRRHSAKPEAFYNLVESLCPGSKVEMFARTAREGWVQWGHEARPS